VEECELCARLRGGLLEALADRELEMLDGREVAARAAVAERHLAEHYGTLDRCLLAAYDELCDALHMRAAVALCEGGEWHVRLAGAMDAMLDHLDGAPGAARLWFVESARTRDARLQERRTAARDRFVRLLAAEYRRAEEPDLPELHFEFLTGALHHAAYEEMVAGREPAHVRARVRELLPLLEPVAA
jgi:AcrR family transcriptional regulator